MSTTRIQLALNVENVAEATEFYERLPRTEAVSVSVSVSMSMSGKHRHLVIGGSGRSVRASVCSGLLSVTVTSLRTSRAAAGGVARGEVGHVLAGWQHTSCSATSVCSPASRNRVSAAATWSDGGARPRGG